jgi:threonine dehydratase
VKNEIGNITLEGIEHAASVIDPRFLNTPQVQFDSIAKEIGIELLLKIETLNPIRSFKGRGASYFTSCLRESTELVAASTGNFGQGLAYAGRARGLNITIFAAEATNPLKVARMREFGAQVVLAGKDFDASKSVARDYAAERGARFVDDGRDAAISEGAGTIAIELLKSKRPLDTVLVPVGNGGLINGIGTWMKTHSPETEIIGVCATGAPAMERSWRSGRIETAASETIAEGVAVRIPVAEAVEQMRNLVDDVVLMQDSTMLEAMRFILRHAGVVTEPAGALGIAAALADRNRFAGQHIAVPICGANITAEQFRSWLT